MGVIKRSWINLEKLDAAREGVTDNNVRAIVLALQYIGEQLLVANINHMEMTDLMFPPKPKGQKKARES